MRGTPKLSYDPKGLSCWKKEIVSERPLAQQCAYLHWASHPWSVTLPSSSVIVVFGKPCGIHGLPGDVENNSSSSSCDSAPSWSCRNARQDDPLNLDGFDTYSIVCFKNVGEELVSEGTQLDRAVVRNIESSSLRNQPSASEYSDHH